MSKKVFFNEIDCADFLPRVLVCISDFILEIETQVIDEGLLIGRSGSRRSARFTYILRNTNNKELRYSFPWGIEHALTRERLFLRLPPR